MARLIFDTGVVIAGVRRQLDAGALADEDDVALPAIVVAEYLTGTLLDPDPQRAQIQQTFLQELLAVVPVHDYDQRVAEHHAELLAHVQRTGEPRGARDMIIAATAIASKRVVVTTDVRARFADLPGVTSRLITI